MGRATPGVKAGRGVQPGCRAARGIDSVFALCSLFCMTGGKRRFPRPWTVQRIEAGFRVVDANGVALCYCYGRAEIFTLNPGTNLQPDEAWRLARGFARLPELLERVGELAPVPPAKPSGDSWGAKIRRR